jgi:hypothetical protein
MESVTEFFVKKYEIRNLKTENKENHNEYFGLYPKKYINDLQF